MTNETEKEIKQWIESLEEELDTHRTQKHGSSERAKNHTIYRKTLRQKIQELKLLLEENQNE